MASCTRLAGLRGTGEGESSSGAAPMVRGCTASPSDWYILTSPNSVVDGLPGCMCGDKHLAPELQQETAESTGHKEAKERELHAQNVGWNTVIISYWFYFLCE